MNRLAPATTAQVHSLQFCTSQQPPPMRPPARRPPLHVSTLQQLTIQLQPPPKESASLLDHLLTLEPCTAAAWLLARLDVGALES
uniref:Uncharacterized protein n=1 Tax=Zea mays TaxID=4577 RepID=C4J738_MAIZE|nr:unknown [Zea mays]